MLLAGSDCKIGALAGKRPALERERSLPSRFGAAQVARSDHAHTTCTGAQGPVLAESPRLLCWFAHAPGGLRATPGEQRMSRANMCRAAPSQTCGHICTPGRMHKTHARQGAQEHALSRRDHALSRVQGCCVRHQCYAGPIILGATRTCRHLTGWRPSSIQAGQACATRRGHQTGACPPHGSTCAAHPQVADARSGSATPMTERGRHAAPGAMHGRAPHVCACVRV